MAFDVGVFAYEGVPLELAQAAGNELESAMNFLQNEGIDFDVQVMELSEEDKEIAGINFKFWEPPKIKKYSRIVLSEDGGRLELRNRICELSKKKFGEKLSHLLENISQSDYEKNIEQLENENIKTKDEFKKQFEGEYGDPFVLANIERSLKTYGLTDADIKEIEDCIVFSEELDRLVAMKPLNYYNQLSKGGIKIISDNVNVDTLKLEKKYNLASCAFLFPFISMYNGGVVERSGGDDPHLPYVTSRGFITVASKGSVPNIGEAVYFWNRGEKQTAIDWATYCLVHEFGGHIIGDLSDLSSFIEYNGGEGKKRADVMRAPLNTLKLQKEIEQYGRDVRLRFRDEDKSLILSNIKEVQQYIA